MTLVTANPFNYPKIPPKLRELYLKIWNGLSGEELHAVAARLHYLDCMFPREKIESALTYLVKSGRVGKNFAEWYATTCKGSNLEMHRELLRAVERERYTRRLTAAGDLQK